MSKKKEDKTIYLEKEKKPDNIDFRILPTDISYESKAVKIDFGSELGVRRRSLYKIDGIEYFRDCTPIYSEYDEEEDDDEDANPGIKIFRLINFKGQNSDYVVKCAGSEQLQAEYDFTPDFVKPRYGLFFSQSKIQARLLQAYAGIPILTFLAENIESMQVQKFKKTVVLLFVIVTIKKSYRLIEELHKRGYTHQDIHDGQILCKGGDITLIDYEIAKKDIDQKEINKDLRGMHEIFQKALELVRSKYPQQFFKPRISKLDSDVSKLTSGKDVIDYLSSQAQQIK